MFVLDTTAFIARFPLMVPRARLYTTSLVVEEVRDRESREGLELALGLGRVEILDPAPSFTLRARREAARRGLLQRLSDTDLSVAALALQLSDAGEEAVVVTDDYALQSLVAFLGLRFQPLRTRGIRRPRGSRPRCPVCGSPVNPWDEACPVCGTPLRPRRGVSGAGRRSTR